MEGGKEGKRRKREGRWEVERGEIRRSEGGEMEEKEGNEGREKE